MFFFLLKLFSLSCEIADNEFLHLVFQTKAGDAAKQGKKKWAKLLLSLSLTVCYLFRFLRRCFENLVVSSYMLLKSPRWFCTPGSAFDNHFVLSLFLILLLRTNFQQVIWLCGLFSTQMAYSMFADRILLERLTQWYRIL